MSIFQDIVSRLIHNNGIEMWACLTAFSTCRKITIELWYEVAFAASAASIKALPHWVPIAHQYETIGLTCYYRDLIRMQSTFPMLRKLFSLIHSINNANLYHLAMLLVSLCICVWGSGGEMLNFDMFHYGNVFDQRLRVTEFTLSHYFSKIWLFYVVFQISCGSNTWCNL